MFIARCFCINITLPSICYYSASFFNVWVMRLFNASLFLSSTIKQRISLLISLSYQLPISVSHFYVQIGFINFSFCLCLVLHACNISAVNSHLCFLGDHYPNVLKQSNHCAHCNVHAMLSIVKCMPLEMFQYLSQNSESRFW